MDAFEFLHWSPDHFFLCYDCLFKRHLDSGLGPTLKSLDIKDFPGDW